MLIVTNYCFPSIPFNRDSDFRLGLVNQRAVNRLVREENLNFTDAIARAKLSMTGYTDALTGESCGPSVAVPARGVVICLRRQS